MLHKDPYLVTDDYQVPPASLRDRLRHLGPSFILSASIVGSGELIATTTLGAKAGFITFWVILVSCMIKVAVQLEFGRHAVLTGETAMQAFHRLPGPVLGKARWSVWAVLGIMLIKFLQVGGIVGGVAIILHMVAPALSVALWAAVIAIVVGAMVSQGYYPFVERFSLVMIAFFTVFTLACLWFLTYTDYAIDWHQLASGLAFHLPPESVIFAVGAFGLTGVGADEIIHYNYWCLEKGYARHTGRNDGTAAWRDRAQGWIRVMYLDALLAMVMYTLVTAAFYLLGAAVLHARKVIPEGYDMIETLSVMYTEALGPGAKMFFLAGSFVVLFSTLFAALAAWTRQGTDIFGTVGWLDFADPRQRRRSIQILAWSVPVIWAMLFIFIRLPVAMIISGGIVGSLLLFLVCYAAYHFRYRRTDEGFAPGIVFDIALWMSIAVICTVAAYGLVRVLA